MEKYQLEMMQISQEQDQLDDLLSHGHAMLNDVLAMAEQMVPAQWMHMLEAAAEESCASMTKRAAARRGFLQLPAITCEALSAKSSSFSPDFVCEQDMTFIDQEGCKYRILPRISWMRRRLEEITAKFKNATKHV